MSFKKLVSALFCTFANRQCSGGLCFPGSHNCRCSRRSHPDSEWSTGRGYSHPGSHRKSLR